MGISTCNLAAYWRARLWTGKTPVFFITADIIIRTLFLKVRASVRNGSGMNDTVAVILGGGRGTRLFPLTKERAKPAVPLAGKYRLIDVPISNCINSELRQIYVLTMYQSASLNAHVARTFRFDNFSQGFVTILAAEQTAMGGTWFQGTADAVRQASVHINTQPARYVLILSGDHLYRMDYREFKASHQNSKAEISIAVQPVSRQEAPELGILKTDASGRIVRFVEKPATDLLLAEMRSDTTALGLSKEEAQARPYLASMGIYFFDQPVLNEVLKHDLKQTDFGKHVIPQMIGTRRVQAFGFRGYWADIGTIDAFYAANMDLVSAAPKFDLFDEALPLYTHARPLSGAKINRAMIENSVICDGVIADQCMIRGSIVGIRSRVGKGASIEDAIIMGADHYQHETQKEPRFGIGEGARIVRAIVDKEASIGAGVQLVNQRKLAEYDDPHERFYVRDGIIVVPKRAVLPNGLIF